MEALVGHGNSVVCKNAKKAFFDLKAFQVLNFLTVTEIQNYTMETLRYLKVLFYFIFFNLAHKLFIIVYYKFI